MSDTFKYVQAQNFTLAGAGATIADVTITLSSMTGIDGALLTMSDFGSFGYGTLEPNSGTQEEQISFTGITQNGNGTATLTGVKNVLFIAPYTETSGLAKTHAGGTTFIISNTSGFYNKLGGKDDDETITGLWNFPNNGNTPTLGTVYAAPTTDLQVASKKYVDDTVVFGAPLASTSTAGIVQTATQAQYDARTQTGSTGAELVATPNLNRAVLTHDYIVSATGTDAYAISCSPAVAAYTAGDVYYFKADVANTGACTLAVNGMSPLNIKVYGLNPRDNYIKVGSCVQVQYDGTNLNILSVSALSQISQDSGEIYAVDSVGTDSYAITLVPALAAYTTGNVFRFKAGTANTGTASLAVNGLAAKTIKRYYNGALNALATGDIISGQVVEVIYESTADAMIMLSSSALTPVSIFRTGTTTFDMSSVSSTNLVITHGLGTTPTEMEIEIHMDTSATVQNHGDLSYDGANIAGLYWAFNTAGNHAGAVSSSLVRVYTDGGSATFQDFVPSWSSTTITLTNTKTSTPTGTAQIRWKARA